MTTKYKEYEQMNITHFSKKRRDNKGKSHGCLVEMYKQHFLPDQRKLRP